MPGTLVAGSDVEWLWLIQKSARSCNTSRHEDPPWYAASRRSIGVGLPREGELCVVTEVGSRSAGVGATAGVGRAQACAQTRMKNTRTRLDMLRDRTRDRAEKGALLKFTRSALLTKRNRPHQVIKKGPSRTKGDNSMKTEKRLAFLSCLLLFALPACDDDSDGGESGADTGPISGTGGDHDHDTDHDPDPDPDPDTGPEPGDDLGEVELTLSGDLDGVRAGMADFYGQEAAGLHLWEISMHDFSPQTFSLTLIRSALDSVQRPDVGTYEIDGNDTGFSAIFTHIPDGDFANVTEYADVLCRDEFGLGGTLTIETSSDELVTGRFQFTVADVDLDASGCVALGSIDVEGEFTARARLF